jgi:hypothetical protein
MASPEAQAGSLSKLMQNKKRQVVGKKIRRFIISPMV